MKRDGFLVKQGDWLIPATDEDRNEILSLTDGEMVPFKLNDARKLWRNKKYWLLLKKFQEHLPER